MTTIKSSEQLHACKHCQMQEVDPGLQVAKDRTGAVRPPVSIRYRGTRILEGASDGCLFFQEALGFLQSFLAFYERTIDHDQFRPEHWIYELAFHYHYQTDSIESATGEWKCAKGQLPDDVRRCGSRYPRYIVATAEDNTAAESIMIRPFVHDLKDSAMWAKACLTECEEKHPKCAFPHSDFAPSRLLKIERIDGAAELHVRLQSLPVGDFQAGIKYATLSYCWGRRQSFKLDKQTEDLLTTGISATSCLPKTLSDAVEVAWDLGISWIWIDCLCIRQDDENEKAAEVAKMHLIYQHSYITISASKALDCYQGFLHQTSLPSAGSRGYILPFSSPCGRLGSVVLCWGDATSPVDKRSWTLQEHLLARRVLRYTDFQLHWTCAEVAMHEVKEEKSLPTVHWRKLEKACRLSSYIRDKDRNCEGWMTLVEEYTTRSLTKRFDILPAMSGIAESWDNQSQDQYLAGLWMSHLPLGLLWTCAQPNEQLKWESYRAPSWSWASREGQIDWINEMALPVDPELSLQEASVQPTHRNAPFGAVESGFIRLKGRLQSTVLPSGGWPWRGASLSGLLEPLDLDLALTHIDNWNAPTYTSGFDTTIHALQICPYSEASGRGPWGLVLAKIGPDTYRRIGVFDFQPPQEDEAKETDNFLALRQHWAARKKTQQRAFRESGLSIITVV